MNPRVTVGLLAVLIALSAYVYFGAPASSPAAGAAATQKPVDTNLDVWTLDESQIQAVSVDRGGQMAGVQRAGDDWTLTPSGEPADRLRVNSLIFRLATVKATYRIASSTNDAEFGLATPAMVAML